MSKAFTIRDTMKVKNTSYFSRCYNAEKDIVFHFAPGEIKEIPTKYIFMTDDGPILKHGHIVVIDTLPDLLEVNEPIENRWEILDL